MSKRTKEGARGKGQGASTMSRPHAAHLPLAPDYLPLRSRGFTLIEMLVVIFIIVVLIGLLIPVVSKVRRAGYQADTQAFISQLSAACQQYYNEQHAYPGPIPNVDLRNGSPSAGVAAIVVDNESTTGFAYDAAIFSTGGKITGNENMVLGLCGGLYYDTATSKIRYAASKVGTGPSSLLPANAKKYSAYAEALNVTPSFLSGSAKTGKYSDGAGSADDSAIPEFLDRYPEPMPLLYLRARLGVPPALLSAANDGANSVITDGTRAGPYDLNDIRGYTSTNIGEGKGLKTTDYKPSVATPVHGLRTVGRVLGSTSATTDATLDSTTYYPYNAYAYFRDPANGTDPTNSQSARAKDSFIIISAGPDRVYGTSDDITSFGPLQ